MNKKYNIGILAHVDAGKTSLTEQLLLRCGEIRKLGSVDEGTAVSDFMDVERRRGISVRNACLSMLYKDCDIHLIDTPGHVDFSGEVVRSLRAIDGVVLVISAAEGVQAQTISLFHILSQMHIPVLLTVNKIDRTGFNEEALLSSIRKELTPHIAVLQEVKNAGTDDAEIYPRDFSDPDHLSDLFQALAEVDEETEAAFLMEEELSYEQLQSTLHDCATFGKIYPLIYSCAKTGKGIEGVLDHILTCLPDSTRRDSASLSGIVFQVRHEKGLGKAAYVRLFSGSLSARDSVPLLSQTPEEYEKITQIKKVQGSRVSDEPTIEAGDIAAVYGLKSVKTGDVIFQGDIMPDFLSEFQSDLAQPLLLTKVTPLKPEQETQLDEALTELSDEDPFLHYEQNLRTHEMHLHIMGEIQIEILREILETRFGLQTEFSRPRVIYKETAGKAAIGHEAYTMPKPCWAILDIKIEPLPPGSGLQYASIVHESELAIRYQNHVETSVMKTLKQGIYGWEVTDAKVTLMAGNSHQWHTHPLDFFIASPIAVLRALRDSDPVLLEPYMKLKLTADENLLGKISGQILKMRGTFDTPTMENGRFTMDAVAPLKDCMEYPVTFRSLTSGKGLINMELDSYRPCEAGFLETMERQGVDPLDKPKWILSCRGAMDGERW